jgi:hypothetical protein
MTDGDVMTAIWKFRMVLPAVILSSGAAVGRFGCGH